MPSATASPAKVSPARRVAFAVLLRVFEQGAYADRALRAEADAAALEPRDRAFAKQLVFGAVQRKGTLDFVIDASTKGALDPPVRAALRLGLHELLHLSTAPHAAISEAVELAKPSPGHRLVNAVLRRVQRDGPGLPSDADPAGAAVVHSHPEWLARRWFAEFGADEARALMAADNRPAPSVLRVNTLVDGVELPPGTRTGDELLLDGPLDLAAHEAFRAGAVTPQSAAAQRVARTVDPQPGERVLDLCAAPGGKTTHLAALMQGTGEVVAVERHAGRASQLRATCERLRAGNVTVVQADARAYADPDGFDRVLLDPPCSGLGTLRTHPDLRWRVTPESITGLVALQDELLAAARRHVRPGGRLVYAVCTLSPPEERLTGTEHWRTLPHRDDTDGFYTAASWIPG